MRQVRAHPRSQISLFQHPEETMAERVQSGPYLRQRRTQRNVWEGSTAWDTCLPTPAHTPQIDTCYQSNRVPFLRRYNFRKSDWASITKQLAESLDIEPTTESYEEFVGILRKLSNATIPRGCQKQHIPGLSNNSKDLLKTYNNEYKKDHFSSWTILLGQQLMSNVSTERLKTWNDTIKSMDMKHSSRNA